MTSFQQQGNNILTNGSIPRKSYMPNGYSGLRVVSSHAHYNNSRFSGGYLSSGSSTGESSQGSGSSPKGFSPQDYLNSPMFDTLGHRRHRYWGGGAAGPTMFHQDRSGTITLGPLVGGGKKHMLQRKLTNCKVA